MVYDIVFVLVECFECKFGVDISFFFKRMISIFVELFIGYWIF